MFEHGRNIDGRLHSSRAAAWNAREVMTGRGEGCKERNECGQRLVRMIHCFDTLFSFDLFSFDVFFGIFLSFSFSPSLPSPISLFSYHSPLAPSLSLSCTIMPALLSLDMSCRFRVVPSQASTRRGPTLCYDKASYKQQLHTIIHASKLHNRRVKV